MKKPVDIHSVFTIQGIIYLLLSFWLGFGEGIGLIPFFRVLWSSVDLLEECLCSDCGGFLGNDFDREDIGLFGFDMSLGDPGGVNEKTGLPGRLYLGVAHSCDLELDIVVLYLLVLFIDCGFFFIVM